MCDWPFVSYAKVYKSAGYPVIAIGRDIRDALVSPLPDWLTEEKLNQKYRLIWEIREMFDLWLRYEDLVTDPETLMAKISKVLAHKLEAPCSWDPERVLRPMLKLDRQDLLKSGK